MSLVRKGMVATLVMAGSLAFGQDKKAPETAKSSEMTMTGCLTKGADTPQHYMFMDQASGKKWTVTGPADLEKHSANHTVRITGSETSKVFTVTKVEHVAATCESRARGGETK